MSAAAPPAPRAAPRPGGRDEELLGKAYDGELLRRLWAFVRPHHGLVWASLLLLPFVMGFDLLQPLILRWAIDDFIATGRADELWKPSLAFMGALVGQYTFNFAQTWATQALGQSAMKDLRLTVFRHVQNLGVAYFDRTPIGRVMTRMTNDIESLAEMFSSGFVLILADAVKLVAIIVIMVRIDGQLTAMMLLVAPFLLLVARTFRTYVRDAFREIRSRTSRINAYLQERLSGVRIVQLFARERFIADRFDELNVDYRKANHKAIRADSMLFAIVEALGTLALAALLWNAGGRISSDTLTLGVLVAFVQYIDRLFAPIRDLSTKYTIMQSAMAAAERVFGLLDTDLRDCTAGAARTEPASDADEAVRFEHVTFSYGEGAPVLRDIDLAVRRGETVAVVGATGSGKSTLVKLLTRLYELSPEGGAIRLGGIDVRAMDRRELRSKVVSVSQDVFLFQGSIADNIALGDAGIGRAQVDAAAQRVGLGRLLAKRTEGLDAAVGERGNALSAGERQLVAFARALVREPAVLVLDEATANVDPEAERLIEAGVVELMRGRTSIVIAHRLSTIERADRVVVLHRGKLVETGTHAELLALGGRYAALWKLQRGLGLPVT